MSGDRIEIRGVTARGRHGVLPHEKTTPAPFVVDVDLWVDLAAAGASDDLADTVSYADVAADVVRIVEGDSVDLIETLAARIADAALAAPLVEAAQVCVHKPEAPVGVPFGDVAVRVVREADRPVVVALGANLGDAAAVLAEAVGRVEALDGVRVTGVSPLFQTDPVGGPDQGVYLNAVLVGRTRLHPRTLLARLHRIEADAGRRRDVRWGPRTLDLDLIAVGDPGGPGHLTSADPALTLPHPRAHERAFVLIPWSVVDPGARLRRPDGSAAAVADLASEVVGRDPAAVGVRPGPAWPGVRAGLVRGTHGTHDTHETHG